MTATFERLKAKGWQAEGDATYGFVFVRRSGERPLLAISIHKFLPTPIVSVASAAALMNLHVRNVATSSGTVWHGDEHPGLVDLAGLQVKPLDRITRVIDLHAFAGGELTSGDARLAILRELAVELFPEVRVGRQVLGPLLPQELQRVTELHWPAESMPVDAVGSNHVIDK
jgi:hypothetical protein